MARKKDDRGTQLPHVLKLEVAALVREKGSIPLSRIKSEYALRYRKPINPKQEISDRWIEGIPGIFVKNSFAVRDDTWRGAQLNSNSVLADRCNCKTYVSNTSHHPVPIVDTVIPFKDKQLNMVEPAARWICPGACAGSGRDEPYKLDGVIASLAKDFIPSIPCVCPRGVNDAPPHGEYFFKPTLPRTVFPNLQFGLQSNSVQKYGENSKSAPPGVVDLDETTSITEYCSTFQHALRLEYEEHLRLYEHYSLYKMKVHPLEDAPPPGAPSISRHLAMTSRARIFVDGISDARPSLQIGDIVLLRPIQPVINFYRGNYGEMRSTQMIVEIESRILGVVRGRGDQKDQVLFSWGLDPQQTSLLRDPSWHRQYNIRFVPSAVTVERCQSGLDWVQLVSKITPGVLDDILFPVTAPKVKPLGIENQSIHLNAQHATNVENSDVSKPLNELQSSFVRMVRARTLDHAYDKVRPPMVLSGPAGTG
eukprot:scaffold1379_cov209-Alexandrium_tamarense.AAC.18